jgi:membrane-associated phospholipid phosphatase
VPPLPPLLPQWMRVRPWLLRSGSELRPPPPPAFGSAEFRQALAEVRHVSDNRTPEQLRIALFWADGAGTPTPPGHWNDIAATLIRRGGASEIQAASILALLNMVLMDASIACWDTKYTHWVIRPSQADPAITTPVGLPNFPSYTSGHATFSGAAAEILGHFYPAARSSLSAMAEEAAMSRLYGGIHYRFDNETGLAVGRALARLALERARGRI